MCLFCSQLDFPSRRLRPLGPPLIGRRYLMFGLPGLTSHLFGLILLLLLLFAHLVESRENTHRWPVKSLAPRGAPKRKKWTPKFGESPNRTRFPAIIPNRTHKSTTSCFRTHRPPGHGHAPAGLPASVVYAGHLSELDT